jgi:hypothetical protein
VGRAKGPAALRVRGGPGGDPAPRGAAQRAEGARPEGIGAIARLEAIRFNDAWPKTRRGKIMRRLLRDAAAGNETVGKRSRWRTSPYWPSFRKRRSRSEPPSYDAAIARSVSPQTLVAPPIRPPDRRIRIVSKLRTINRELQLNT